MERPEWVEFVPDKELSDEENRLAEVVHKEAFVAQLQAWEADLKNYEASCPRHPLAGPWLKANPTPGVECVDRQDGLGPRLCGWPKGMEHPDFEAFAAEREKARAAAEQAAKEAAAARAAARAAMDAATTIASLRSAAAVVIDDLEARLARIEAR